MADPENKPDATQAEGQQAETTTESSSLISQAITKFEDEAKSLSSSQQEVGKLLIEHLKGEMAGVKVDKAFFAGTLEEIDRLIGLQLDEIMHHDDFQKLEASWGGLKWLVDRTDFNENIRIELLNVSKKELLQDFEDAVGDITTTGLYQHIYSSQYGAPNGKPYGAMIVNYEFAHYAPDVALMSKVAEVANMAHAPMISAVSPELFGPKGFEHLTDNGFSVAEALAGAEYAKWNGFLEDENARYVGLTLPRFLLRNPYSEKDNPVDEKEFKYEEQINKEHNNYLWGNAAFTFAGRLSESFKKYRWCWRIVGEESGGAVNDLNVHTFMDKGELVQKPPTEIGLTYRKEEELNQAGMIPLLWMKEKDQSVFYRAPSFKKPLRYPDTEEGRKNERDDKLRCRLPFVFVLTRFAHYIKRLQTKYIGKPISRTAIEKELTEWIMQYVNADKNPQPGMLGKQPLFAASVSVEEDSKNPGVFLCDFQITPHTMAEGFTTTLSLVTRQDFGED